MRSIRVYLVVLILSVVCLSNFIAALRGYQNSLRSADTLVNRQFTERSHSLSVLIKDNHSIPEDLFDSNTLFQVWQEGNLMARSGNAPDYLFSSIDNDFHMVNYDSQRWRAYSVTVDQQTAIIVAQRYDFFTGMVEDALLRAIIPIIWVLPLLGVIVLIVIHVGLTPLRKLSNKLSKRSADDFSPLEDDNYPKELMPFVTALNSLFQRLSEAFEIEKRFSADAAHELRTPLAALKVELYNLSKETDNPQKLSQLSSLVNRMGQSIEQLLEMHRVSLDINGAEITDCNLVHIASDVIAQLYDNIENKNQQISLSGDCSTFPGDAFALEVLVRNLVDNASKYTPEGGTINVTLEDEANSIRLRVEDSGPGIPESEYSRVTERFYRVGGDRHSSGVRGSGLGLSIVAFVTRLHGAQMFLSRSDNLGGLAIELLFPKLRSENNK